MTNDAMIERLEWWWSHGTHSTQESKDLLNVLRTGKETDPDDSVYKLPDDLREEAERLSVSGATEEIKTAAINFLKAADEGDEHERLWLENIAFQLRYSNWKDEWDHLETKSGNMNRHYFLVSYFRCKVDDTWSEHG